MRSSPEGGVSARYKRCDAKLQMYLILMYGALARHIAEVSGAQKTCDLGPHGDRCAMCARTINGRCPLGSKYKKLPVGWVFFGVIHATGCGRDDHIKSIGRPSRKYSLRIFLDAASTQFSIDQLHR